MRELVFESEDEPDCNEVADTLAVHSNARLRALSLHTTETHRWRISA